MRSGQPLDLPGEDVLVPVVVREGGQEGGVGGERDRGKGAALDVAAQPAHQLGGHVLAVAGAAAVAAEEQLAAGGVGGGDQLGGVDDAAGAVGHHLLLEGDAVAEPAADQRGGRGGRRGRQGGQLLTEGAGGAGEGVGGADVDERARAREGAQAVAGEAGEQIGLDREGGPRGEIGQDGALEEADAGRDPARSPTALLDEGGDEAGVGHLHGPVAAGVVDEGQLERRPGAAVDVGGEQAVEVEAAVGVAVEDQDAISGGLLQGEPERAAGTQWSVLLRVREPDAELGTGPQMVVELVTEMPGGEGHPGHPLAAQSEQEPLQEGAAGDLGHRLGAAGEHRLEAGAQASAEDHAAQPAPARAEADLGGGGEGAWRRSELPGGDP